MNRLLHTLVTLAWGLWFGGLVMLFVAVTSLFHTFAQQRFVAGAAASGIFQTFNHAALLVAAAALLLTFIWWLARRSALKIALFTLFALATVAAVYSTASLTPRLEEMRIDQATNTPDFRRLHGFSMAVYLGQTLLVLAAGTILPHARGPRGPADV